MVEVSQLIILAKAAVGLICVVEIKLIVELGSLEYGVYLRINGHLNEHLGVNLLDELLHGGLYLILCKDVLRNCLLDILVMYQDIQSQRALLHLGLIQVQVCALHEDVN